MAANLAERVSILERAVSAEIKARVKMQEDMNQASEISKRMIQAVGDTQSDHTRTLREIKQTIDRMAPKVDSIETQMHGVQLRIGHVDGKIDTVTGDLNSKFNHLDGKIDTVTGDLNSKIGELDQKFNRLDGKIDTVAQDLNSKFDTVIDLLKKDK